MDSIKWITEIQIMWIRSFIEIWIIKSVCIRHASRPILNVLCFLAHAYCYYTCNFSPCILLVFLCASFSCILLLFIHIILTYCWFLENRMVLVKRSEYVQIRKWRLCKRYVNSICLSLPFDLLITRYGHFFFFKACYYDFSALFFNVSVCVYLMELSELLVCMNDWVKLCFTILCISTYYLVILCSRYADF